MEYKNQEYGQYFSSAFRVLCLGNLYRLMTINTNNRWADYRIQANFVSLFSDQQLRPLRP